MDITVFHHTQMLSTTEQQVVEISKNWGDTLTVTNVVCILNP